LYIIAYGVENIRKSWRRQLIELREKGSYAFRFIELVEDDYNEL
jgi:hypothetical protein